MRLLEVGLCTWSVDRDDVAGALSSAKSVYGVEVVHVGVFDETTIERADPEVIVAVASSAGVTMCATFVGFEGLDRRSIASVERTGGLRLDAAVEDRLGLLKRAAALTRSLGVSMLAAHLGAVPRDADASEYATLRDRVRRAADTLAGYGVTLLAETGQESAEVLDGFLSAVDRDNVGVNFDPGNLVMCGTGDPVRAVTTLSERIRLVHLKDAIPSSEPGARWGRETALGLGEANIPRVISKLRARGYTGPLLVERSLAAGETAREDIEYVRSMLC